MGLPSSRTEFRIVSYDTKEGKTRYAIQERHRFPSFGRWWWHFVVNDWSGMITCDTKEEAERLIRLWKTPQVRNMKVVKVVDENYATSPKKMWGA
jgi:hypothetical protein